MSDRMKEAFHEIWGGSPKHDAVNEMFASGWNALFEALGGDQHFIDVRTDEQFDHTTWTIQHPITERLDGSLFECPFTQAGGAVAEAIVEAEGPGRYALKKEASALLWEAVT